MATKLVNTIVTANVGIPMRDGVVLYCDIIRPDTPEKVPAILVRTAYLKENIYAVNQTGWLVSAFKAAARGYAFVVQDARGTGWSQGVVDPSGHQDEDGYDTVEAVAAMPWCDGSVGMMGESFLGYVCLEAAKLNPPHLKAIVPCQCGWHKHPYMLRYGVSTPVQYGWTYQRALSRDDAFHDMPEETKWRIADMLARQDELIMALPLSELPLNDVPGVPGLGVYRDMLEHLDDYEYFARLGRVDAHDKVKIPVLNLTGWLDMEVNTTIHNYIEFRDHGGSELTRENTRLIVGPWRHGGDLAGQVDEVNFGPEGSGYAAKIDEMILDWFDHWLKGTDSPYMRRPPVRLFMMGANKWFDCAQWPPECAQKELWYLHSKGGANGRCGNGTLSKTAPSDEKPDTYLYDPGNPVTSMQRYGVSRFADQRETENRGDMLVYTTAPFDGKKTISGPVEAHLFASSSAVDTDFAARLLLIEPCGKAVQLCANLVRARYRLGRTPDFLEPGRVYEYTIDVGNLCMEIPAGYSLRLEVMSSLFPVADRNLNTGGRIGFEKEYNIAIQRVFHEQKHPSALQLYVIV